MVRTEFHEIILNLNYGVLEINSNNFNSYYNAYYVRYLYGYTAIHLLITRMYYIIMRFRKIPEIGSSLQITHLWEIFSSFQTITPSAIRYNIIQVIIRNVHLIYYTIPKYIICRTVIIFFFLNVIYLYVFIHENSFKHHLKPSRPGFILTTN